MVCGSLHILKTRNKKCVLRISYTFEIAPSSSSDIATSFFPLCVHIYKLVLPPTLIKLKRPTSVGVNPVLSTQSHWHSLLLVNSSGAIGIYSSGQVGETCLVADQNNCLNALAIV
jgi:hypothetical protein